jgi:hypothetical protein
MHILIASVLAGLVLLVETSLAQQGVEVPRTSVQPPAQRPPFGWSVGVRTASSPRHPNYDDAIVHYSNWSNDNTVTVYSTDQVDAKIGAVRRDIESKATATTASEVSKALVTALEEILSHPASRPASPAASSLARVLEEREQAMERRLREQIMEEVQRKLQQPR